MFHRIAMGIVALSLPASAGKLVVKLLDEQASPAPARVYLTGTDGKAYTPDATITYRRVRVSIAEAHFVPPAGAFEIDLPAGTYRIDIERGKEYLPVAETLAIPANGRTERTFRLRRWIRMSDRSWYSADMHPHRALREMAVLMEAEDLNVTLPITRWRTLRGIIEDRDLPRFLEKSDAMGIVAVSRHRWLAALNEELEPRYSALLVSRLGRKGTSLEYPLAGYGRAARDSGALADSEKATSLQLPVVAALGGCDFVGLANNHFWRSGYYAEPWGAWPHRMLRSYPET